MKAHKIEVLVIDFEDYGVEAHESVLENQKHTHARILNSTTVDIGEWHDRHPLNLTDTPVEEIQNLFKK